MSTPAIVHLHIRRLVIDDAAVGTLPRDRLAAQIQAALAERLSESAVAKPTAPGLAGRIADAFIPQLRRSLPSSSALSRRRD